MKKISVIVPIYNVEAYLQKCVDSILRQTYTELEIILVDDGSPDGCPFICDEYKKMDPRIKVIHKSNGGLSDARNAGVRIATGEWLSFVDSDDWLEPDMYEVLLGNAMKHNAKISVGSVAAELFDGTEYHRIHPPKNAVNTCFVRMKKDALRSFFHNAWAAWDKIYHRSIFDGIEYPVGEINEDEAIAVQLLDRVERIVYSDKELYHYVVRTESITTSSFSQKKLAWAKHCRDNLAFIQCHHPDLELDAAARYRGSILWSLTELALANGNYAKEMSRLLKELRDNSRLFWKAPFENNSDRIRLAMLLWLPFDVYQKFMRRKRSVNGT